MKCGLPAGRQGCGLASPNLVYLFKRIYNFHLFTYALIMLQVFTI